MTEAEKDALIAQLTQRNEELEKQVIARKFLPKSISGTIQLSFPKEGETVEKTYSIRAGFPKVWTPQGNQVTTETALSLALGNTITQAQLSDNPHLLDICNPNTLRDNGNAKALFVDFAKRGAQILVEMEVEVVTPEPVTPPPPSEPVTPPVTP